MPHRSDETSSCLTNSAKCSPQCLVDFSTLLRKGCHKNQEMSFGNEVTKTQTRYLYPQGALKRVPFAVEGDYTLGLRASARFRISFVIQRR